MQSSKKFRERGDAPKKVSCKCGHEFWSIKAIPRCGKCGKYDNRATRESLS